VTFEELEHAIRAACDVVGDTEVVVFGSQAILGTHRNAHVDLRQSVEADISPLKHPELVDAIDGALGEGSQFHSTFGFYVHGVPVETATLPKGWRVRTAKVCTAGTRGNIGWCLDGADLAASKLAAFREKDREFVRILLREQYITARKLIGRIRLLPQTGERTLTLVKWVDLTAKELRGEGG
jgi:hypothetical protein